MRRFIIIPTNTIEGLRRAERYYARGWKLFQTRMFSVTLCKVRA